MKIFISIMVGLLWIVNISFAETNISGNVSGTWTVANSPYIATNNLVLQPTDTLIIDPGVEVKFDGNYRFDIFGTFLAVGTESDSITFTRNGSTNWMSLNFADDADDNSQMQYCIIEYGTESGYDPYWGVVNFNLSSPTISHCRISNCSNDGIYLHYSEAEVSNNVITNIWSEGIKLNQSKGTITGNTLNNIYSTSIYLQENSDSTQISNNIIDGGYSYGIYANYSAYLTISQNQITDKEGIRLENYCTYATIDSNTISNNSGRGIYLQQNNNYVTIQDNSISNNSSYGIYLYYDNKGVTIQDNSISGNNDTGIRSNSYSYGNIIGNLIYNNGQFGIFLQNVRYGDCEVRNNTIDGHTEYGLYLHSHSSSQYTLDATNNSITNNVTGIYCDNGGNYNIVSYNNCWNNSSINYSGNLPGGTGNLTDINSNGIVSDIYYNISEYPQYTDQANGDFTLQEGSPNIDAGDPNNQDSDGSISDIGYMFFYQAIPSINFSPQTIYLNRVLIGVDTTVTLDVYNSGDSTLTWSVSPDSDWVSISPTSGTITPGDTASLSVVLSTSTLPADTYTPSLIFTSNDPDSPTYNYTITIRILNSWRVSFSATAGGVTDGNNIFGFDEDATDGLDSDWDEPEPPPEPVNYLQVGFLNPGWSNDITFYTSDIRNYRSLYESDVEVWACSLSTDLTSSTASLAFTESSSFPDGYSIWVIDGSDTTDVTNSQSYTLSIDNGGASFGVMVQGVIPDAPVINISQPIEGQILTANQQVSIEWTAQNTVEYFNLSYSIDNGESWTDIITYQDNSVVSYTWTVPNNVHSTQTYIKVFADGAGSTSGYTTVGELAIIPSSFNKWFGEGWSLFSLPLISSTGQSLNTVFDAPLPNPHYAYSLNGPDGYELIDDTDSLMMDEGYWLAMFQDAYVSLNGNSDYKIESISLSQGWNLVSCPQPFDVDTSDIKVVSGMDTVGFTNAVGAGLLGSTVIYSWNDTSRSYNSDNYLSFWNGHWLSALSEELELLVYPEFRTTNSRHSSRTQLVSETEWYIEFDAIIDGISDYYTVMGVTENGNIFFDPLLDIPSPPSPPGGTFVQAYFDHADWNPMLGNKYNADIQNPLVSGESRTWVITLDGNTNNSFLFQWSDFSETFPENYSAYLTIENTGELINMQESSSITFSGNFPQNVSITVVAEILSIDDKLIPEVFALHQNYPNPFNPTTQIRYDLPEDALVTINIYDLMGRSIKSLVNSNQTAGYRSIRWDGKNNLGEGVSAGMYIYMIQAGEFRQTRKMVLLK